MMGSTCSAGSDLGVAPLAEYNLRPTRRKQQVLFLCTDGHACKPYFGKFPYGVVESFQKLHLFWIVGGKFSKATLILDSRYDVLGKVFKSYNARMTYQ
jgi:hypothetical protein